MVDQVFNDAIYELRQECAALRARVEVLELLDEKFFLKLSEKISAGFVRRPPQLDGTQSFPAGPVDETL